MILVVAAMEEEARLFLEKDFPQVKILITGVGKVNAAMSLAEFIAQNQVDAIYNLGFAGATTPFKVSDLVLITDAIYHDFDLSFFGYQKGQVPGYPERFTSDKALMNKVKNIIPNIKSGHLYTGDYFMTNERQDACIIDMEGAALYQVAYQKHIPIVSVKVISDVMGMDNHYDSYKKFESNHGAQMLNDLFIKLFEEVSS